VATVDAVKGKMVYYQPSTKKCNSKSIGKFNMTYYLEEMREWFRVASYKGLQKNLFPSATNDASYYHRAYSHKYDFDIFYQ
jgi:hypothetical protein